MGTSPAHGISGSSYCFLNSRMARPLNVVCCGGRVARCKTDPVPANEFKGMPSPPDSLQRYTYTALTHVSGVPQDFYLPGVAPRSFK
jgi:hypothetical protein